MKGTIDRFEGELAVIKLESGAELLWPKSELVGALEGEAVSFRVSLDREATEQQGIKAKEILNEILKSST